VEIAAAEAAAEVSVAETAGTAGNFECKLKIQKFKNPSIPSSGFSFLFIFLS
jgi:hypothetical protein